MEEKRLIDANAFLKDILTAGIGKTIIEYSESDIAYMIRKRPTVDAVEVVRCRDCKHRGTDYCIFHIKGEPADEELLGKLDNDFCSYGERKGGDGDVWKEKDGGDGG